MRVVIGEDSALFREGLARLLADAGHEIVAKAVDAPRSWRPSSEHRPDVAIIDVRMPPDHADDGARAARRSATAHPELGILLLSQHVETRHSVELVSQRRLRLPAQGPRARRRGLPRRAGAGSRPAAPRSTPRWSAGCSAARRDDRSAPLTPVSGRCSG